MKTIILFFSFVSVLCLISCNKTDSDSDSKPEPTTTPKANQPGANTPPPKATPTPKANQPGANTPPPKATPTPTTTEHFTFYVPEASLDPYYELIFYASQGKVDKTVMLVQGGPCAKVHKNHLTLIKVKKTKSRPTYIPSIPPRVISVSFEDVVIYEKGRSGYRVGIYKPSKTDDSLIKVEADDPKYLRYKNECSLRKPT